MLPANDGPTARPRNSESSFDAQKYLDQEYHELRLLFPMPTIRYWIEKRGCILRRWETAWSGPVVLCGQHRAFAICKLTGCTPAPVSDERKHGYFYWHLSELHVLEQPILYRTFGDGIARTPEGLKPQICASGLIWELNALFAPPAAETVIASREAITVSRPLRAKSTADSSQFALF